MWYSLARLFLSKPPSLKRPAVIDGMLLGLAVVTVILKVGHDAESVAPAS